MTSFASPQAKADAYKQQYVMTASPGELTLMLYDGCIKEIKLMRMYIGEGSIEKASNAALQAQAILSELMRTLDMSIEMSTGLYNLYDFMIRELTSANVQKQVQKIEYVLQLLEDLRDTWQQAVRANRLQETGTGGLI